MSRITSPYGELRRSPRTRDRSVLQGEAPYLVAVPPWLTSATAACGSTPRWTPTTTGHRLNKPMPT